MGLGIGSVISSAIDSAAGIYSSHASAKYAQSMQKKQLAWEKEKAQNAHQWEVEDLIKAGLNPILSSGGSGAVAGSISAPTVDTSGITSAGKAVSEGLNNYRDYLINKQNADSNKITAETNETVGDSTTALNYQKASNLAKEMPYIKGINSSQIAKNWAEASEKSSQIAVNKANIGLMESQRELTDQKGISEIIERQRKNAEIKHLNSASKVNDIDYKLKHKQKRLTKNNAWKVDLGVINWNNNSR